MVENGARKARGVSFGGRQLFGQPTSQSRSGAQGGSLDHPTPSSRILVGGSDLRFYHREDCPMAAGRNWPAAAPSEHDLAKRIPCGMCRP
jgi:hypothetical protein